MIEVGALYASCSDCSIDEVTLSELKSTLKNLIFNSISYDEAKRVFEKLIGSTSAVEHIWGIINVSKTPLPSTPEEDDGKHKSKSWTPIEDMRLLHAITVKGIKDWSYVAKFVGNSRTRGQCSQRWHRTLNPGISKNSWSTEDDEKLLKLVEEFGDHAWAKVSAAMSYRTDVQCRYRYQNLQKKTSNGKPTERRRGPSMKTIAKEILKSTESSNSNSRQNAAPLPVPKFDQTNLLYDSDFYSFNDERLDCHKLPSSSLPLTFKTNSFDWQKIFSHQASAFKSSQVPQIQQIFMV